MYVVINYLMASPYLLIAYLQALIAMVPGKAEGIQQIQKLVGDLVAGLSAG